MPNLLPNKNKKNILNEFILRFVVVSLTLFFVVVCIAIVLLIPSYILSQVREISVQNEVKIFEKAYEFRKENSSAYILDGEILKMRILQEREESSISDLIFLITKNKPTDIKILGIFYEILSKERNSVEKDNDIQITVRGEAKKRNSLIDFVNKLKQESQFVDVNFPVSNLIKEEGINFSIQIKVKSNII
jgi:hypothetical protein